MPATTSTTAEEIAKGICANVALFWRRKISYGKFKAEQSRQWTRAEKEKCAPEVAALLRLEK